MRIDGSQEEGRRLPGISAEAVDYLSGTVVNMGVGRWGAQVRKEWVLPTREMPTAGGAAGCISRSSEHTTAQW